MTQLWPKVKTLGSQEIWPELVKRLPRTYPRYRQEFPKGMGDVFRTPTEGGGFGFTSESQYWQQMQMANYYSRSGMMPPQGFDGLWP